MSETKKERMQSHDEEMSQHCADQSEHCQNLADSTDDPAIAKCMGGMAQVWKSMSACHAQKAGVSKSLRDEMLANRGFPDGISSVIPAPQIRAVPRFGQQDISKTEIDPQFADLFKADL